jgi:excisionase family DNA binding protein
MPIPVDNLILSQIPLDQLLERVRVIVKEEIETIASKQVDSQPEIKIVDGKELCKFLNITAPTLIRMRKRKSIPFIKAGRTIRYDIHKVMNALKKNSQSN